MGHPRTIDKSKTEMPFVDRSGWQSLKRLVEPRVHKNIDKQAQPTHCWWE